MVAGADPGISHGTHINYVTAVSTSHLSASACAFTIKGDDWSDRYTVLANSFIMHSAVITLDSPRTFRGVKASFWRCAYAINSCILQNNLFSVNFNLVYAVVPAQQSY